MTVPPVPRADRPRGTEAPWKRHAIVHGADTEEGALLWDFLVSFIAARHTFLAIYERYEARVRSAVRRTGVGRDALRLPPKELFGLFNLDRLRFLKEVRLWTLRDMAERIFAESTNDELLDLYCSHIYHELSILAEEHRSVGRFVRIHDPRRYRQLFDEVSGYYPQRLRRIRRLFTGGLRRIETLLPSWSEHRVIIRGMYFFGDRHARLAYGRDVTALYRRMYPEGTELQGFLEASRSFLDSGFMRLAREAADKGREASRKLAARRNLERPEQEAADELESLLLRLDEEAGVTADMVESSEVESP